MYMLVLQTFLLMMAAFLLGASLACLCKRSMHKFSGVDVPEDDLKIEVPPAVPRSEPVKIKPAAPPVGVTRAETKRFERALAGDAAEAAATSQPVRPAGPVIEVQPLPVPPPAPEPVTAAPKPNDEPRDFDEVDMSPPTTGASALATGETYNAIAVASHDGSMLPPPAIVEADLPPPAMPLPAPEPLPVPRAEIPAPRRPEDAPEPPHQSYIDEAIAAGIAYVAPPPEPDPADINLAADVDPNQFPDLPPGATYASVALGGVETSAAAPVAEEPAPFETKATHASTAIAAAAGIAAQRAAGLPDDAIDADDLTRIRGIDEVLASRLNYLGVYRFTQIANWTADDVNRMSQSLGFFGRVKDEYWIDQAREFVQRSGNAPPPASPPSYATSAGAADIATAAAAAAAASLVASSARSHRDDTPMRPVKLADAIREYNSVSADDAPVADDASQESGETSGNRSGLSGLRSVRAEALLGDDPEYVRGSLDDLKRIRGIGVLIEKKLNSLGITSYEQVANWSTTEIERISEILDFKGRIERENWIEQARILASGGQTEFSRRVDRGEV